MIWKEIDDCYWLYASGQYAIYVDQKVKDNLWLARIEEPTDEKERCTIFSFCSTESEARQKVIEIMQTLKTVKDIENYIASVKCQIGRK